MTLTGALDHVVQLLPGDVTIGPPFTAPPVPPCYVVELPSVENVEGIGPGCEVTAGTVDVVCVPPTATDRASLLAMADAAIAALGPAVTAGTVDTSPYTDIPDTFVYRLTVEV